MGLFGARWAWVFGHVGVPRCNRPFCPHVPFSGLWLSSVPSGPRSRGSFWLWGPRSTSDSAPCCRGFLCPSSAPLPSPKVTFSLALRSQQSSVQVFPLSPSQHFQKKFKIWANSWQFQTLKGPAGANYSKKEKRGGEGILCCAASSSPRAWIRICRLLGLDPDLPPVEQEAVCCPTWCEVKSVAAAAFPPVHST